MTSWGGSDDSVSTGAIRTDVIRVLIADDDDVMRHTLARIVDRSEGMELAGSAADGAEAVRMGASLQPDVALIDVSMPGWSGVEVTEALRTASPATRIVALSGSAERTAVLAMLAAGAAGYLLKGPSTNLAEAVRAASRGEGVLAHEVASDVIGELSTHLSRQHQEETEHLRQRNEIFQAIDHGLRISFQPVVSLASRRVVGHEALSRFGTGPTRPPDQWFAQAWSVGLGFELETCAFQQAVSDAGQAQAARFMSVNLSPVVLTDPRFAAQMESCSMVDRLILEVTEHAVVDDYDALTRALNRFRAAGARVAIDDAGAGHSSLRHVLILRPDIVKIDISLITGIHEDPAKQAVAAGIISSTRDLGAVIVAEGIEKEAELRCVADLGAHYGQGYLLGRPSPLGPSLFPTP